MTITNANYEKEESKRKIFFFLPSNKEVRRKYIKIEKNELYKRENILRQQINRFGLAIIFFSYSIINRYSIYGTSGLVKEERSLGYGDNTVFLFALIASILFGVIGLIGIDAIPSVLGIYPLLGRGTNFGPIFTPLNETSVPEYTINQYFNFKALKDKIDKLDNYNTEVKNNPNITKPDDARIMVFLEDENEKFFNFKENDITDDIKNLKYTTISFELLKKNKRDKVDTFVSYQLNLDYGEGEKKTFTILDGDKNEIDSFIKNTTTFWIKLKLSNADTNVELDVFKKLKKSEYKTNNGESYWYVIQTETNENYNDNNDDDDNNQENNNKPNDYTVNYNISSNTIQTTVETVTTIEKNIVPLVSPISEKNFKNQFLVKSDFNSENLIERNYTEKLTKKIYLLNKDMQSDFEIYTLKESFKHKGKDKDIIAVSFMSVFPSLRPKFLRRLIVSLPISILPFVNSKNVKWNPKIKLPSNRFTRLLRIDGKHLIPGWKGGAEFLKIKERAIDEGTGKIVEKTAGNLENPKTIILTLLYVILFFISSLISQYYIYSLVGRFTKATEVGFFYRQTIKGDGLATDWFDEVPGPF